MMRMMKPDNMKDAREVVPGFFDMTQSKPKRSKRVSFCGDDSSKVLAFGFDANPLALHEQKLKIKANLNSKPKSMEFFPHVKEERNKCAKLMYNNVTQMLLCKDSDLMAVADHRVSLLSNDPDPTVRAELEELKAHGHRFYDPEAGDYDENTVLWWADEYFFKGAMHEVDLTDKQTFVTLYSKFTNGVSGCDVLYLTLSSAPRRSL